MLLLAALTAFAPAALASNTYGPKVDDAVATAADAASRTTYLNLVVTGSDAARALSSAKALNVVSMGQTVASGQVAAGSLSGLAKDSRVEHVAPDLPSFPTGSVTPATSPGVPYAAVDRAPYAWNAGYNGAGIGIAVLDSGVSSTGSTLTGRLT